MLLENLWSEASSDAGPASRHRSHVSMLTPQAFSNNIPDACAEGTPMRWGLPVFRASQLLPGPTSLVSRHRVPSQTALVHLLCPGHGTKVPWRA